ncbi:MAG: hypothetical protein ABIJ74_01115 [archaeon]
MKVCSECKRPLVENLKELEELFQKPYLIAIADNEFIEFLKKKEAIK